MAFQLGDMRSALINGASEAPRMGHGAVNRVIEACDCWRFRGSSYGARRDLAEDINIIKSGPESLGTVGFLLSLWFFV